jgi:hypothetical protein
MSSNVMLKFCLGLFSALLFMSTFTSFGQRAKVTQSDSTYIDSIKNYEYQLEGLSHNVINGSDKVERITSCYYFIETLKTAIHLITILTY